MEEAKRFRPAIAGAALALILALGGCGPEAAIVSADKSITITYYEVDSTGARRIAARMAEERRRVRKWWGAGFDGPIRVEISQQQSVSMALIPAWRGDRGKMLLPSRVVHREATPTLHELVHIEAPNGNRFLAEGLAVYLQARLGVLDAYPDFGADLHVEAGEYARQADISRLDTAATPRRIESASQFDRQPTYLIAGSFVRFLIETHGKEKFLRLYELTPFRSGERIQYDQSRYGSVYGVGLAGLAQKWRDAISR